LGARKEKVPSGFFRKWERARKIMVMIARLYCINELDRDSGLSPAARNDLQDRQTPTLRYRLYRRILKLDLAWVDSHALPKNPLCKAIW
jgi:hypothetical protein